MSKPESLALILSGVVVLAIGAQWVAWKLRFPAILLLLMAGLACGPGAEALLGRRMLAPDALLGDLLLPVTSLAVGLILFEGGLSLRLRDVRAVGGVLSRLITGGALVTWLGGAAAAWAWGLFELDLSLLLGAIVVVTGPTVIGPLLRQIRPTGESATVLRWEGIVIDPIGATLALLVFEAILHGSGAGQAALSFLRTALAGALLGSAGAALLVLPLRRHALPDYLEAPVAVMLTLATCSGANAIQAEAGLLATTVMGVLVGNLLGERALKILHFKESLVVLLISVLFVLLAARVTPDELASALDWRTGGFLATLVLLVRPLSVAVATAGSTMAWRDRAFLAWMAPRGIVAAAVASVFALRLTQSGRPDAAGLAPIMLLVIIGTVAVYALTAPPLARRLGLAVANPRGLLILGAEGFARELAASLARLGVPVRLVDSNREHVQEALALGFDAVPVNVLSDLALETLDTGGLGQFLALTSNDEVNSLAVKKLVGLFGRAHVFQLVRRGRTSERAGAAYEEGRRLFAPDATHDELSARLRAGERVAVVKLLGEHAFDDWRRGASQRAMPLLLVTARGAVRPFAADSLPRPAPGDTLVSLEPPPVEAGPTPSVVTSGASPAAGGG